MSEIAEMAEHLDIRLEPWQVAVLEAVLAGERLTYVMPRRHAFAEYDSSVKAVYRALGYEIVYGHGWWGARQPECASPA